MVIKIWKRLRQFLWALSATVPPQEHLFIRKYLNQAEQQLFYAMAVPDQAHSLRVAHTALQLAKQHPAARCGVLVKAALLHDVGKRNGDMSTVDKSIAVLVYAATPGMAQKLARLGRGSRLQNLRHALYIYRRHGLISAARAAEAGVPDDVCTLVRDHHTVPHGGEPLELTILRQADQEN